MNQYLENIQNLLRQNNQLIKQDREALLKAIADADKQWNITDFKLERTEKVKKTTAMLLEETIAELEQKRKAVEAQNRELEIEAALEKVRSRSLAMRKSDELQEVAQIVSEKLTEFNVEYYTVIITFFQEGSKDVLWWLRNVANQQYSRVLLRYSDNDYLRNLFEARENGRELFSKCYALEEKKEFYDYLFKDTALKYTPDQQKKILLDAEFATMSVALAKNTGIHLTRYSNKSFSDEDNEILKKFAKVFDQAYTRFLDLQKAEAQAREAQIELALERVRARTMAMQNSDELAELVAVLFKELTHLDFLLTSCIIWINTELSTNTLWVTSSEMNKPARPLSITPFYHSFFKSIIHAWKAKDPKWIYTLSGEEKSSFEKAFFNDVPDLPDALKAALTVPEEAVFSASLN